MRPGLPLARRHRNPANHSARHITSTVGINHVITPWAKFHNEALLSVCDAQTRIVPGSGPVQTRSDLQAQRDMLATMKERLVGMLKKGMASSDMLAAAATKEFDAKWGDPTLFVTNAYRGLWGHVRELGGIV